MTIVENHGKLSMVWGFAEVDTDQGTIRGGDHSPISQRRKSHGHGRVVQSISGQNFIFGVEPMQPRAHAGYQQMAAVESHGRQSAGLGERLSPQILSRKRIALQPLRETSQ